MSFVVDTYIPRPAKVIFEIGQEKGVANVYSVYPELCFVHLDNYDEIMKMKEHPKFSPRGLEYLVTIKYEDKILIGYNAMGNGIWLAYINAVFYHLLDGQREGLRYKLDKIKSLLEDRGVCL